MHISQSLYAIYCNNNTKREPPPEINNVLVENLNLMFISLRSGTNIFNDTLITILTRN